MNGSTKFWSIMLSAFTIVLALYFPFVVYLIYLILNGLALLVFTILCMIDEDNREDYVDDPWQICYFFQSYWILYGIIKLNVYLNKNFHPERILRSKSDKIKDYSHLLDGVDDPEEIKVLESVIKRLG